MAKLKLNHIYKVYDNGHKAVNDFSIDIEDKEFIVFVGPSGCGKSTTLRMIAGLEEITAGELYIGDTLVNDIEPMDRDIAMVFQNYALYPHMSVYDNMAFGLRNVHMDEKEIKERVTKAASILGITDYLDRKPKEMSGGQRQRVALGRAIVRNPKVFLLDEPLSNLDAKLRAQMRTEITKLHKKLGTTFIYVTHDQVEAMTMGTRIVVMKDGFVQQIDKPMNLYDHPINKFVAGFIGTPQMNFFDVSLLKNDDKVKIVIDDNNYVETSYDEVNKINEAYFNKEGNVTLGLRPENIKIVKKETSLKAKVNVFEQLGNESLIYASFNLDSEVELDEKNQVVIKIYNKDIYNQGDIINLEFDLECAHYFDKESEVSIKKEIPDAAIVDANVNGNSMTIFGKEVSLPNAYSKLVKENASLMISPYCFEEGTTFTLKVLKCEKKLDNYLLALKYENKVLFALTNKSYKKDDDYSFDLAYDKMSVLCNDKIVLAPISNIQGIEVNFEKEKSKDAANKKVDAYYLKSSTFKYCLSNEKGIRISKTVGKKAKTKQFLIKFDISSCKLIKGVEKQSNCVINEVLDYGNAIYYRLDNGALALGEKKFNAGDNAYLPLEEENVEICLKELDMRIC